MRRLASTSIALGLLLPALVAACSGATRAAKPSPSGNGSAHGATQPPDARPMAVATSTAPAKPPEGKPVGSACTDATDDAPIDVALTPGTNGCPTTQKGACADGVAICERGKVACLAPPPMPEVIDGIDNDCNGVVDDVADAAVRPRALLLAPRYEWADASPDIANVVASMAQAGISLDRPVTGSHWGAIDTLDRYALAVVPGYLLGSALPPVREKLEAFVERGGVLVVFKPIAEPNHAEALELTGLRAGTRHRDIEELRFDGPSSPATALIDSAEERVLGINPKGEKAGVEVWTFEADPQAHTEVLANAYRNGAPVGAALTRRRLGKGSVYAVGHDLASFGATRCAMNCFEASGDVMRLVLDGALREGSQGHVAVLSTTPALSSSVLVLTHDVNSHESQYSGAWGEAGALQFAKVEQERGVHATFNVLTDYRGGNFNANTVHQLCALGMCPTGVQGVARVPQFSRMSDGMVKVTDTTWRCRDTREAYTVPSLCGEVFISSQLVQSAAGRAHRSWRSPYLGIHAALIPTLSSAGIPFDSTFVVGDLPHNLPVDWATTGIQQRKFQRRPVLEFPIAADDAIDRVRGGAHERIELQSSTEARFRSLWQYILRQNQKNHSFTTIRISPSRGEGMSSDNLQMKAFILSRFLDDVAHSQPDVLVRSIPEIGDFWRARLDAKLDVSFDSKTGYVGTLTIGKTTAPGLTIELGDAIKSFSCPSCGVTQVAGKRAVILGSLPPGTKAEFTASVQ